MVCVNTYSAKFTFNELWCNSGLTIFNVDNKKLLLLSCFILLLFTVISQSAFAAGDAAAGQAYFANKCTKCHGKVLPKEHDAFSDLDTTANPLSFYASDPAMITKAANEGYTIPEGNSDEKAKPGTSTNVPMKFWVGMGKDRLGEGKTPSQLAIDISAYFASFFDPPSSPTINGVSAKDAGAIISFTTPKSDLTITGYSVVSDPGKIVATGTGSPITITGLTNGTSYKFTVSAISNAGTSRPSSASNAVTPIASASPATTHQAPTVQTAMPQTSSQPAVAPQSSVPQTPVQKAVAPQSSGPQPTLQKAVAPQSSVPQPTLQKAAVPQSSVPQTSVLKAVVPHSSVSKSTSLKATAPQSSVPATKVQKSVKPKTSIPQSSVSQASPASTK